MYAARRQALEAEYHTVTGFVLCFYYNFQAMGLAPLEGG
jgi:hypothetical protein